MWEKGFDFISTQFLEPYSNSFWFFEGRSSELNALYGPWLWLWIMVSPRLDEVQVIAFKLHFPTIVNLKSMRSQD